MGARVKPDEPTSSGWWKPALLVFGAAAGAAVAWGWLSPESPRPPAEAGPGSFGPPAAMPPAPAPAGRSEPAPWVKPTILWAIAVVAAVLAGAWLLGVLSELVFCLFLSLFFSLALEPAVNFAQARWGWRRGATTGLLLLLVLALMVLLVLIFVPALLKGLAAIAAALPQALANLSAWASKNLGIDISTASAQSKSAQESSSLQQASQTPIQVLLGVTASLVGGLFAAFTIGMFIFYMVADASKFRRAVLSFFSRERQEEVISVWEAAIDKTGGYFYSRMLLACINGGFFYVMLRITGVPGAAALALFEGVVAEFIPIVGTYIAATVPIMIAFATVGWPGALVLLVYVLIYQQVENYLLAPKIQGRTMQLHPAVAFAAALAGGAIGGLLWAFLALPFAATIQASASLWVERHEVVDSELTRVQAPPEDAARDEDDGPVEEGLYWVSSTRGWLRRRLARSHDVQ